MIDSLEPIAALIAAIAALAGAVGAVSVVTQSTRLRHRTEMLRAEIDASPIPHDRAILESIHRDTTATIVAHLAVPTYKLFIRGVRFLIGVFLAIFAGVSLGFLLTTGAENLAAQNMETPLSVLALPFLILVLSLSFLWGGFEGLLKSVLERRRVAVLYLRGQDIDTRLLNSRGRVPVDVLEAIAAGTAKNRKYFNVRLRFMQLSLATPLGTSLFIAGLNLYTRDNPALALQAIVVAVMAAGFVPVSADFIRDGFSHREVEPWVHPRFVGEWLLPPVRETENLSRVLALKWCVGRLRRLLTRGEIRVKPYGQNG